jgi:hypothetical protein
LQLLGVTLTLGVEAGVKIDNQGPNLYLFVHGEDDLTLLAGRLSIVAEVYVPAFKLPPWEKKEFEHVFLEWAGIKKKDVLFNVPRSTPLSGAAANGPAPAPAKGPAAAPAKGPAKAPAKGPAPAPAKATPKASPAG